jgi:hypothetical protein
LFNPICLYAPAQLDVLQPVEREQRTLNAAQLTQCDRQAVLARVAELSKHQGGGHRTQLYWCREPQDFIPMGANMFDMDAAADQAGERRIALHVSVDVEVLVGQVADAWREAETQQGVSVQSVQIVPISWLCEINHLDIYKIHLSK